MAILVTKRTLKLKQIGMRTHSILGIVVFSNPRGPLVVFMRTTTHSSSRVTALQHHKITYNVNQIISRNNSPRLLVAELFRYHFPQIQSEAVRDLLGQILVGAPAKNFYIGHFFVCLFIFLKIVQEME